MDPSLGQSIINLGLLLEKTGRKQEALEQWHVAANPTEGGPAYDNDIQTMALNHIGRVYENHKQYVEAERALERSLAINTKQTGVLQHWIHIRQKACAWPVYKSLPGITHNDMLMATSPLAMLAITDDPVQQLLTAHAFVGRTYGFKEEFLCKGRVYTHDRIRIGYVSGDLCTHAVGLLLPEVFEGHDRAKFEVYAYDFSPEDGTALRARLKASFDHLRRIDTLTDRQVAELVLHDEIDVLIDLHGLSSGARPGIFALHPAPKQGTYLGFIGTTGMPWFDFVIADKYVLPEELTPYFTEKPLYVEGSFIPLTKDETPIREAKRLEFDLPEEAFVMAAFGNVYKITPEMYSTWLEILKEIPKSILWLIDDNTTTTSNLKAHAIKHNADVNRIIFTPRASHAEYCAKLKLADVFLDTFPYNCGSTTNDVINAGVPLVTMSGRTMVSRMGGGFLVHLEEKSSIAYGFEQYKQKCQVISKKESINKINYLSKKNDLSLLFNNLLIQF
jgi:predicted O-linked N-acetylglucosamine transferase (SPINDLY family)